MSIYQSVFLLKCTQHLKQYLKYSNQEIVEIWLKADDHHVKGHNFWFHSDENAQILHQREYYGTERRDLIWIYARVRRNVRSISEIVRKMHMTLMRRLK